MQDLAQTRRTACAHGELYAVYCVRELGPDTHVHEIHIPRIGGQATTFWAKTSYPPLVAIKSYLSPSSPLTPVP